MEFYERIKELCKKQGITIRQLVESVGMNFDSYNGLKRYNNFPRLDEAVKIAEKLNTSVYYLLNGVEYIPEISDEEKEAMTIYHNLAEPYRESINNVLKDFSKLPSPSLTIKSDMTWEEAETEMKEFEEKTGKKVIVN